MSLFHFLARERERERGAQMRWMKIITRRKKNSLRKGETIVASSRIEKHTQNDNQYSCQIRDNKKKKYSDVFPLYDCFSHSDTLIERR